MTLSSIGPPNLYSYLQWPQQPANVDSSSASAPNDPLLSLFGAFTAGSPTDPLLSATSADGETSSGTPPFSPDVMSALLSVQGGQNNGAASPLQSLFGQFDADGDGKITQAEFENAIGPDADKTKVDALFSKLDANGDGSISPNELQTALQQAHGGHHHHHHSTSGTTQQSSDPLQALLSGTSADGGSSQSVTNSDGSTTTTITYADGSTVDMTTPASSTAALPSSSGSNLGNVLEQLIRQQAQLFAPTVNLSV